MTTKCCCCKCECHATRDGATALFLAVFALLFFLATIWYINGPKSNTFSGYAEGRRTSAQQLAEQRRKTEEWAQYWYVEFQYREPARFDDETVNRMKAICKEQGAQFRRVDFYHKISSEPVAVCLTNPGTKHQSVTAFSKDGYRKVLL